MLNLPIPNRGMLPVAAPVVLLILSFLLAPPVVWGEETLNDRKERIAKMSPAEKEELRRKKERFDKFDEDKREKLREIQRSIASDPQSRQLTAVMQRYRKWLSTLTVVERDELRNLQGQARVQRIKELMERQWRDRIRGVAFSREERGRVYRWLAAYFKNHQRELLDDLPAEARQEALQHQDSPFFHMILLSRWKRDVGVKKSLPLDEQDIEEFKQVLPAEAQELFDETTDLRVKRELAAGLILASLPRSGGRSPRGGWHRDPRRGGWGPGPRISVRELHAFFDKLTDEERREVTRHHSDEMHRELMKLYFKKNPGSRREDDRRGPPRGRRPDRRAGDEPPPKARPPRDGPSRG